MSSWVGLTSDDLLGTGVVDLLLGGVGGEHLVKYIRLPLWRPTQAQAVRQYLRLLSTPQHPL